jgi:CBS domain containing-hemolysin-like protein
MTSLALGWVGEPVIAQRLLPVFRDMGIDNEQLVHAISFAIGFGIITFLHIVFGEQAPKWVAIQKPTTTALWLSYPLSIFTTIFKPLIWLLNTSVNGVLWLMGFRGGGSELAHSQEELRLILSREQSGSATEKSIVLNALDFRRKQARHCMVPRTEMIALCLTDPLQESIGVMRSNKFSRFPVYKESIDNILGLIYTKDIFKQDKDHSPTFTLEGVLRDVTFLPETASLEKVLETMLSRKTHMVILADEYGGTAGLITLENVLEELVGPIQDEFDREAPEVIKFSESEYLMDAGITTNEVEQLFSKELSPLDIRSIGAFVLEQLGHIPESGERVTVNGIEFTVEQVTDRMIDRIRVKRLPQELPPTEL